MKYEQEEEEQKKERCARMLMRIPRRRRTSEQQRQQETIGRSMAESDMHTKYVSIIGATKIIENLLQPLLTLRNNRDCEPV